MKSWKSRKVQAALVAASLIAAAPAVIAHTEIKTPALEGTTADNAVKIGHGCETATGDRAIIAQSVVFPTQAPVLTASDASVIGDLSEVIDQGSLAGLIDGIQDRSIFLAQQEKYDANGNVIGFSGTAGVLSAALQGRVPFEFTAPNFVQTSCANRLIVELAIADICVLTRPTIRAGKVNLWIPDNGSTYATTGGAQGIEGIGEPGVLIVNRDQASNPLDPSCGTGIEVTVSPSAEDVNANLPIPGVWR